MKKSFTAIHLCGKAFLHLCFEKDRQDSKNVTIEKKYQ